METEILISDYLPQVFRVVKCFARPVVLQKQLQPGRLTLEGYIRCTVYYQGEGGAGLCQTEQKLPFQKTLELPAFSFTSWSAAVEGETEYINCRAVTPRRIEVRGAYGLVASVSTQCSTEAVTALSGCGIQQRQVTLRGVKRAAVLDKLFAADGAIPFAEPPRRRPGRERQRPRLGAAAAQRQGGGQRGDPRPLRLERPGQRPPSKARRPPSPSTRSWMWRA